MMSFTNKTSVTCTLSSKSSSSKGCKRNFAVLQDLHKENHDLESPIDNLHMIWAAGMND